MIKETKTKICPSCFEEFTRIDSHLKTCPIEILTQDKPRCAKVIEYLISKCDLVPQRIQHLEEENQALKVKVAELEAIKNDQEKEIRRIFNVELDTKPQENTTSLLHRKMERTVHEKKRRMIEKEFSDYESFCQENKYEINVNTAKLYLEKVKQTTYVRKRLHRIKKGLQLVLNAPVEIEPIHVEPKKKFCFDDPNDLFMYLREQFVVVGEDKTLYVIQVFLAKFGLRINTASFLQWKHLYFKSNMILLPDKKDKNKSHAGIASKDFINFFRSHMGNENDNKPEDYVFFPNLKKRKSRNDLIRKKVSEQIKSSNLIKYDPELVYSSHCLRKTRCFQEYTKKYKKLLADCGFVIGHSPSSTATEAYISYGDFQFRPEASIPMIMPDGDYLNEVYIENTCPNCGKEVICDCITKIKFIENPQMIKNCTDSAHYYLKPFKEKPDQSSIDSLIQALKSHNLEPYNGLYVSNHAAIEEILENTQMKPLSREDAKIYRSYDVYSIGSLCVMTHHIAGYYVVTKKSIPKNTLICEYGGDVIIFDEKYKNDSIFTLSDKYCICPILHGNIGKYIAGTPKGKKSNVLSCLCLVQGMPRILLYSAKNIKPGFALTYDYNANVSKYPNENFVDLNLEEQVESRLNSFK